MVRRQSVCWSPFQMVSSQATCSECNLLLASSRYLAQMTLAGILVTLALFSVVRPALKFYMTGSRSRPGNGGLSGELSPRELELLRQGDAGAIQDIKTKLMPKKSSIPEDMLDTANTYDEKIALMKMISADDPGRVANLVKRMLSA